ncbi:MAG: helix-turn-helix domain-containing protein [Solirubrobacteraceae bacterium]
MPSRQHLVRLTTAERRDLERMIGRGRAPARQLARARILLKADRGVRGRRLTDRQIADAVAVAPRTVARVRAEFAGGGVERALRRQPPRRVYPRKLDGAAEAVLVELACGPAPDGRSRWSLRLLGDALVRLEIVEAVAPNTIRATLKKTSSSLGW